MNDILQQLKGGLIVSCQALPGEPLHMPGYMVGMAEAAKRAGAVGIRSNGTEDVRAIRKEIALPVIGLIKFYYDDSEVYITPTMREAEALVEAGADIIAIDATDRIRPFGEKRETFFEQLRRRYPKQLFMADCATIEDGVLAEKIGYDIIGTTMCGYTKETQQAARPPFEMIRFLSVHCKIPVFAEGGIWTPEELKKVFECGAYSAVIGSAITRPYEIAKRFVEAIL